MADRYPRFEWSAADSKGWSERFWGVILDPEHVRLPLKVNGKLTGEIRLKASLKLGLKLTADLKAQIGQIVKCSDYISLVTSQHRKPKFLALMRTIACPIADLSQSIFEMAEEFDIDQATGAQLDLIGQWVGVPRKLKTPMSGEGVWFAWNGTAEEGWNVGYWKGFDDSNYITEAPDKEYRLAIKARIARNIWDGTISGAYEAWGTLFEEGHISIIDKQDMTMEIVYSGIIQDEQLLRQMIRDGYFDMCPVGVKITKYTIE